MKAEINLKEEIMQIINERQTRADGVTKKFEDMFNKINKRIDEVSIYIVDLKKDLEFKITDTNAQIKNNLNKQIKDNDDNNKKLLETKEQVLKSVANNSEKIDQLDAKSEKTQTNQKTTEVNRNLREKSVSELNEKVDSVHKMLKNQIEQTIASVSKLKEETNIEFANKQAMIAKNSHRYDEDVSANRKKIQENTEQDMADKSVVNAAIQEQKKRVDIALEKIEANFVSLNNNKTEYSKLNLDTNAKIDKINQDIIKNIQANKDKFETMVANLKQSIM